MKNYILLIIILFASVCFNCNNNEQKLSQENNRLNEDKNQLSNEISNLKDSILRINDELKKVNDEKEELSAKIKRESEATQKTQITKQKSNKEITRSNYNSKPGYDKKRDVVKLDFGRTNLNDQYRRK